MDRHGWDARYAASEQTFTRQPNRLVVEAVQELGGPGLALDLGCGEGRHAVWLASQGWRVVGVDFSLVGVARASALARAEGVAAAFAVADFNALRLPPDRFDLVLAAFFHPRDAYAELTRAIAPGGTFLQVSYDIANLTEGTGGPRNPDFLLRPQEIAGRLRALGLRVEQADTVRLRIPAADGREVDVVDAVIRATKASSDRGA